MTEFKILDGSGVKLVYDNDRKQDTMQSDRFFGIYGAVVLSREGLAAEVAVPKVSEIPIVNKSNTLVMSSAGVIKESDIAAKQAIPELVWPKSVLTFDSTTRSMKLIVTTATGFGVNSCKADFFEANEADKKPVKVSF